MKNKKLELTLNGKIYFVDGKIIYPAAFLKESDKLNWLIKQTKTVLKTATVMAEDAQAIKNALSYKGGA